LTSKGVIPVYYDIEERSRKGEEVDPSMMTAYRPLLMGQCAAAVTQIMPAADIIDEMLRDAVTALKQSTNFIAPASKL